MQISYIGMQTQEVGIKPNLKVILKADSELLDEVVVTAMGVTKSEKSLGYSATVVGGEDLIKSRKGDVLSSLSGKVAGVQVSSASGDPGAANSIIIRGVSSLNGNQPLFVVDGVPLVNNAVENETSSRLYYSLGNGANMVNPDDVESMTVLKGAAATALYGSRAANGVIIITTKSGSKKDDLHIEVNSGVQFSKVAYLPEMQNTFGMGWSGLKTDNENGSWGPAFDNSLRVYGPVYNNSQLIKPYSALEDNVKEFFETGVMYTNSVSLSGGNEKTTYYTSFSNINDDGILPYDKDTYNKTTLSFRGSHSFKKWLNVSSSVNIANQHNQYAMGGQGVTVIDGLYEMPRDISILDLKDLNNPFNQPGYYYTPYGITNPYYALEYNFNDFKQQKVFGKAQIDINPIQELKLTYRFGFDYSDYESKVATPKLALEGTPNADINQDGSVDVLFQRRYETNHDFLANYNKLFESIKLDVNATVGLNVNERAISQLKSGITNLTIPSFYDLSNSGGTPTVSETFQKRRLVGLFGDLQLGYNNLVFLNVTARNDWSSTLPIENNSFFYPGITGSFLFTELIPKNNILSFGKVRIAWGKTGNDADVYQINPYYVQGYANHVYQSETTFPLNGVNAFKLGNTIGSSTLQPEMTSEVEIGANLQFFNGRLGIDAAYYDRRTKDQIFSLGIDGAAGYRYAMVNLGEVSNKGVELLITTVPIQTKDFKWTLDLNFTKNNNKVLKLPEGNKVAINYFSTSANAVYMYAEEGQPMGTLWTYTTEKDPNGNPVVDPATGRPIVVSELSPTGKNVNSDWEGGVSTSFAYKGFTLSCDFDIRQGGYMFSRTKDLMAFTGNGIATMYNGRKTYIIPHSVNKVTAADGSISYVENTTPIASKEVANGQYNLANGLDGDADLLMDRSFIKMRSLALSYDFPQAWMKKIYLSGVRVSFVANNLFAWRPKENIFVDPESTTEGVDLRGKFGELYTNPSSRRFGFNVQVKF